MRASRRQYRRLILGMAVEEAKSKFDSVESRVALRVAHERHNEGVLHELQIAQRMSSGQPPERRCFITRFTKPSVPGFQAYAKDRATDYVVRELWGAGAQRALEGGEAPTASTAAALTSMLGDNMVVEGQHGDGRSSEASASADDTAVAVAEPQAVAVAGPAKTGKRLSSERSEFAKHKRAVLGTLAAALESMVENAAAELEDRRQSGSLLAAGQRQSVLDRLVGEAAGEKGYKNLSSSTHLLDSIEMTLTLFARKDKDLTEAFSSPALTFPAREGDISLSLWIAGGLIANERLIEEFPFHIAKYAVSDGGDSSSGGGGGNTGNRLPRVDVEIYFSPELYHLHRTLGQAGLASVRRFVGKTMMKQHEPTPASHSLMLNATPEEQIAFNLYSPSTGLEGVAVPWAQQTKLKLSPVTGVVLSVAEEGKLTTDQKRDAVTQVWKAWGHLIKDLHVQGDLDCLYISIDRAKEIRENDEYIKEVRATEEDMDKKNPLLTENNLVQLFSQKRLTSSSSSSGSGGEGGSAVTRKGRGGGGAAAAAANKKKAHFLPLATDFVVVECLLERCGLPHQFVVEDLTEALSDMQAQSLESMRLAMMDELESLEDVDVSNVVPVVYVPRVVVTHAGNIENGTHSFQRIRIRGSCLAHVLAIADSLASPSGTDDHSGGGLGAATDIAGLLPSGANLSFTATRQPRLAQAGRLLGHRVPGEGRDAPGGVLQLAHAAGSTLLGAATTVDEQQFWKENYYRLSEVRLVFHERVEAQDAVSPARLPKRVQEVIKATNARLTAGEGDEADAAAAAEGDGKKKRKKGKRKPRKIPNAAPPTPEKLFEYLCADMETEMAAKDLRPGDCSGYEYNIALRRIPRREVDKVPVAMRSVQRRGFINYFGPQRFSTFTRMNMHPGLHLLKGEFQAAAHVIVQQFYLDAALEAERRRTGSLVSPSSLPGFGRQQSSLALYGSSRRSVAEHGSVLQRVLHNALQATVLLRGEQALLERNRLTAVRTPAEAADDPCAEAFLNVVGPRACRLLVQEFLCFVWNELVNQRLQRYGTFSVLPGDLVCEPDFLSRGMGSFAGDGNSNNSGSGSGKSQSPRPFHVVTRKDLEKGRYNFWNVVLPLPGADIQLPENHTADLYIVTMRKYGLVFDPEARQWGCFYPGSSSSGTDGGEDGGGDEALSRMAPHFAAAGLTESEMGSGVGMVDYLSSSSSLRGGGVDLGGVRADLRRQDGNPLQLYVPAGYRTPLRQPVVEWKCGRGVIADPLTRWGAGIQRFTLSSPSAQQGEATPSLPFAGKEVGTSLTTNTNNSNNSGVGSAALDEKSVDSDNEDMDTLLMEALSSIDEKNPSPAATAPATPNNNNNNNSNSQSDEQVRTHVTRTSSNVPPPLARAPLRHQRPSHQRPHNGYTMRTQWRDLYHGKEGSHRHGVSRFCRALPLPAAPYWFSQNNDGTLALRFAFPPEVYPSMLLREITKMDVNARDVVDIYATPSSSSSTAASGASSSSASSLGAALTTEQRHHLKRMLAQKRQRSRPQAVSLALLHQQIFRSGGVRNSLIPTLRSFDSVVKH